MSKLTSNLYHLVRPTDFQGIGVIVAAVGSFMTYMTYNARRRRSAADIVQRMMHEYSQPEFALSIDRVISYAAKHGDSFAYRWAQAKGDAASPDHAEAQALDADRRKWTLFYSKFMIFRESGLYDLRGPFTFGRSRMVEDKFPGQFRAAAFTRFVEPMDYAHCRLVLGRTCEQCKSHSEIFRYLRERAYPGLQRSTDADEVLRERAVQFIEDQIKKGS